MTGINVNVFVGTGKTYKDISTLYLLNTTGQIYRGSNLDSTHFLVIESTGSPFYRMTVTKLSEQHLTKLSYTISNSDAGATIGTIFAIFLFFGIIALGFLIRAVGCSGIYHFIGWCKIQLFGRKNEKQDIKSNEEAGEQAAEHQVL